MAQEDYYQVLGVDQNTPDQQIKESFRKLAFKYPPVSVRGSAFGWPGRARTAGAEANPETCF